MEQLASWLAASGVTLTTIIGWVYILHRQKVNEAIHIAALGEKISELGSSVSRLEEKVMEVGERVSRIEGRLNGYFGRN